MFPSNLSYYLTGVFSGVAIIVGVDFHSIFAIFENDTLHLKRKN